MITGAVVPDINAQFDLQVAESGLAARAVGTGNTFAVSNMSTASGGVPETVGNIEFAAVTGRVELYLNGTDPNAADISPAEVHLQVTAPPPPQKTCVRTFHGNTTFLGPAGTGQTFFNTRVLPIIYIMSATAGGSVRAYKFYLHAGGSYISPVNAEYTCIADV